jgi:diadenosine tetraphosphate (Ap4A) HIT family hydrolase
MSGEHLVANQLAVAVEDRFPVSKGHALVIPRRHVETTFDLDADEHAAVWTLVRDAKRALDQRHAPDAYNVGTNAGLAAGQTVAHAHVHVIPRYRGDVADPRGGVRWVLPQTAAYWTR